MNTKINYKPTQNTYKKLSPFKGWVLNNFPFVAEDFDALTEYEYLCKIVEYLNKISHNQVLVEDDMTKIYNAFTELQNYINNYFDNLDVQEEINNKLNEMVQDGTLQEIITNYLKINGLIIFANVADMIGSTNLISGSTCKTLGFYDVNDGGSAIYRIENINNTMDIDDSFIIPLDNTELVAILQVSNEVNILQLGAKKTPLTLNKSDIAPYIERYIDYLGSNNDLKLYIPSGCYYCSQVNIARNNGFYIYGDECFSTYELSGTIISSFAQNQDYIFNIGNNTIQTYNWVIKNIQFTTSDFENNNNTLTYSSNLKNIKYCFNMLYAQTGITDNLIFSHIMGGAIQISTSWENIFKNINCRYIYHPESNIINFATVDGSLTTAPNITNNNFDVIMIESVLAESIIHFDENSGYANNNINNLFFEETLSNMNNLNIETTTFTNDILNSWDDTANNLKHVSLFSGHLANGIINNINLDVFSSHYYTYNETNYVFDTIFENTMNNGGMSFCLTNLYVCNAIKDMYLYTLLSPLTERGYTINRIDNINNITNAKFKYNVSGAHAIINNSLLTGTNDQYTHASTNIIPSYSIINRFGGGTYGLLYSDDNCLNNLKLAVQPFPQNTSVYSMKTIATSNTLHMRAKIPTDEVVTLTINNGSTNTQIELTGTGNYQLYSFDNVVTNGSECNIRFNGGSVSRNCLIDYISF